MDVNFTQAILAGFMAACTWYMRKGSSKDKDAVNKNTDAEGAQTRKELASLRAEFDILKVAYFKQNPVIDHRGPSKGESP